ncbi:MAG: S10 family peptidase [Leadbetterella sp.]
MGDKSKVESINADELAVSDKIQSLNREAVINNQKIPYKVTCGKIPVFNETTKPIADCFFTYYERTDIKDKSTRPLVFSFNGGPGTASVWMHIAYTGPKLLNMDDEGNPTQPYGYKDNPHSILDVADIVFVDPVNTGFSRIIQTDTPKGNFFGVKSDIKYLADWIVTFVNRQARWTSPKYLIGESYGTTRVSGLALELQSNHWMYFNGVVLVSPTDLGLERDQNTTSAIEIPYFAATAWYHKKLSKEYLAKDLDGFLPEVEKFALEEYLPLLARGNQVSENEKSNMAKKISAFIGIPEKVILQNNLQIMPTLFWKELLREDGFTIGRLDSRYKGLDSKDGGEAPEYNSELIAWLHAFTPAINSYLRDDLGYKSDLQYNMFGPVHPWERDRVNIAEQLRQAMAQNPFLNLMTQSGYYDGACEYFSAKYNHWQMDEKGVFKNRMSWKGYRSGHMMYLRKEDLKKSCDDLREFIKLSLPPAGRAAKY